MYVFPYQSHCCKQHSKEGVDCHGVDHLEISCSRLSVGLVVCVYEMTLVYDDKTGLTPRSLYFLSGLGSTRC